MGVEVLAGVPALDHDIEVRIVDADIAVIGNAALLLERLDRTGLVPLDEVVLVFRLHGRGGDDIDHLKSSRFSWFGADTERTLKHDPEKCEAVFRKDHA